MERESLEQMKARHQKELKAFEGEKRSALKKIKGTSGKGKKGKEMMAKAEKEYEDKFNAIKERHNTELETNGTTTDISSTNDSANNNAEINTNADMEATKPKKTKAQRKREKARLAEKQREAEIAADLEKAGPSPRDLEIQRIMELYLVEKKLTLKEISADGNCLYRAIASQCQGDNVDYKQIRKTCAQVLSEEEEEFMPFAEIETTYENYVDKVASSSEWGGHLELRALAMGLKRPIVVYSADAPPLIMGEEYKDQNDSVEEIRLSFHRYYYALGEHYNSVVPISR